MERARVLKADATRELGAMVAFNLDDLNRECDTHLEAVRAQARGLIEEAVRKADATREEARKEGFARGREEGLKEASQQIAQKAEAEAARLAAEKCETAVAAVEAIVSEIAAERDLFLSAWETAAIDLAAGIAHKLLGRIIELDTSVARDLTIEALRLAVDAGEIRLRLHPDDAAEIGPAADGIRDTISGLGTVVVTEDSSIRRGDCIIDTNHGRVDGRLGTRIDRIVAELTGSEDELRDNDDSDDAPKSAGARPNASGEDGA